MALWSCWFGTREGGPFWPPRWKLTSHAVLETVEAVSHQDSEQPDGESGGRNATFSAFTDDLGWSMGLWCTCDMSWTTTDVTFDSDRNLAVLGG